jgi:hypothetical protein
MLGIGKMFRSDPMTAPALSISVESGGLTPIPTYIYQYEYEGTGGGPMSQQNEPTHNASITIFPNPFTERLNIVYQTASENKAELKVYDVTGRLVKQFALPSREALNQIIWDGIDDQGRVVPQGVYFLRVDNPDSGDMLCQKVLKVR